MSPAILDALTVAGITAAVNAIVTWRVMLAVVNARLDAIADRVRGVEAGTAKAHERIDDLLADGRRA